MQFGDRSRKSIFLINATIKLSYPHCGYSMRVGYYLKSSVILRSVYGFLQRHFVLVRSGETARHISMHLKRDFPPAVFARMRPPVLIMLGTCCEVSVLELPSAWFSLAQYSCWPGARRLIAIGTARLERTQKVSKVAGRERGKATPTATQTRSVASSRRAQTAPTTLGFARIIPKSFTSATRCR